MREELAWYGFNLSTTYDHAFRTMYCTLRDEDGEGFGWSMPDIMVRDAGVTEWTWMQLRGVVMYPSSIYDLAREAMGAWGSGGEVPGSWEKELLRRSTGEGAWE